jgi:toxin-antitoxin system PIN domain toxin
VTTFLLDLNVLIALLDPTHVHHDPAHQWFAKQGRQSWATCPITENAVLRIVGNPRYPNTPGAPAIVAPLMESLCALPGHVFWPDDIRILNNPDIDSSRLLAFGQITDSYLLALARAHKGLLATFDRRLVTNALTNGAKSLHLIG